MLELPVEELFPFSEEVVSCLHLILSPDVPRKVVDLVKKVWFKIHSLMPRRYMRYSFTCQLFKQTLFLCIEILVDHDHLY